MAARRVLHIDVVSDTICPWCYVGAKRLQKAIAASAHLPLDFEIRWRPFFLDTTLPKEGKNKMEHYKAKFGAARTESMLPMMKTTGEKEGIKFSYGGMIANTMDSHRIMTLAWKTGGAKLQNAVCDSLMKFYFEEEGNLGDRKALTAAAVRGGLPEAAVTALLEGDELEAEVAAEATDFQRRYRISGVPFFILDGKLAVSGAQEEDVLAEAFEQIADKKA